jgi:hypothetical protein
MSAQSAELEPPPILYHYTTLSGVCGIATKKSLWASSIRHLSDATEFTHAHDVLRQALEDAARGTPSDVVAAVEFLLRDLDGSKIQIALNFMGSLGATYVASFSSEPDKLSQWRAYCQGGGYALGFRTGALQAIAKHQGFKLVKCSYDRGEHLSDARTLVNMVLSRIQDVPQSVRQSIRGTLANTSINMPLLAELYPIRRDMLDEIQQRAPMWKHHSFHEEAEWRLVSEQRLRNVTFRTGRTAIVPYVEIKLDEPADTQVSGMTAVLSQTYVGPCPEPEIAVGSLMHLFEVEKMSCPQYTLSPTPYRHW